MTTFLLIRHGSNDFLTSTLIGRAPGIHLNSAGRSEAGKLADGLARAGIQQIFSSPMERCTETAEPLARRTGLPVEISDALNEVDFGDWIGRTFAELDSFDSWKQWNAFRSGARIPNGETMLEVQSRVVAFISKLRRGCAGQRIALFSHGDPLRAALVYFLGMPLEMIRRIELSPASFSVVAFTDWDVQIRCINAQPANQQILT